MTKKSTQSFWHWVSDRRISFWLNISPRSFTDRYSSCRWAGRSTSSWSCFSLWSARKSKYIRLQRKFFELHLRGFLLVVVVLLVAHVRDQLIQAMRNSDPRVRIVFVYRFNSNVHSMFTLQVAGCDFWHGPNFGIPSNPTFRVRWFSSLCKVYSRHASDSVKCEISSVSFVMKYCPTPTVVRNPASLQILITRICCESLSTCSWYFCNRSSFLYRIIGRRCRCFRQQTCWLKQWVKLSCQYRSPRSYLAGVVFPHTNLRLLRGYWQK